jgi:hypothetical protein
MPPLFLYTVRCQHVIKPRVFFDFARLEAPTDEIALTLALELLQEVVLDTRFYSLAVTNTAPIIDL